MPMQAMNGVRGVGSWAPDSINRAPTQMSQLATYRKTARILLQSLTISALLLTACANTSQKRSELAASGFRTIPATTPGQLARLNSLKSGKVVPLKGPKGTVYVFADIADKALLIGTTSQYEAYRKLKLKQQKIDEQLLDAQVNMDSADWNAWGPDATWGWAVASEPY